MWRARLGEGEPRVDASTGFFISIVIACLTATPPGAYT